MEELITMFVNNGTAVACLIYFMWYNNTTLKEFSDKLEKINAVLIELVKEIGHHDNNI